MQEAYRLPCSKYSLCCPNWGPPGRVPPPSWPGRGGYLTWVPLQGTPTPPAGYPALAILTWPGGVPDLGTPSRVLPSWPGYPLAGYPPGLDLAGYPPSWPGQGGTWPGYPLQGTPTPPAGYPTLAILTWPGGYLTWVSQQGTPHPDLGTPWQGTPPGWTWQGTPLHRLDLAGYPPPSGCPLAFWEMLQSIMRYGYPPPDVDKLTKWNYYLPVVLCTPAVIIHVFLI